MELRTTMKNGKKPLIKIFLLLAGLAVITGISVLFFPTMLNFNMGGNKLLHVVLKIRLPETLIAITAGACLGLAGALMQIILGNPLASPFTLGISSASAFGAALAICMELYFEITWLNPGMFAFVFSLVSILLLLVIMKFSGVSQRNIILIGLAVNFFFNAANTFLQYFATPDAIYRITFWTAGSLTTAELKHSGILFSILVVSLLISLLFSKDLGIIQQGERNAVMHGVNVTFERVLFLLICSLLASSCVSIVGIIGFVGLVAPHISRLMGLESPKELVLSASLSGALLLVIADILSKTIIHPTILPISAVTSIFGIPLLLFLLIVNGKKQK